MPPKKGKKPKLTKAQKAKLKLEEEQRRLREEEEARIQAEREEQERLERQRRQEILDMLEAKDSKRRGREVGELHSLLEKNYFAVIKYKNDAAQMCKWEKYMQCGDIPDPGVQQDINTFISLWRDDPTCNIKTVFKQCNLALQLIEELEVLLREVTDEKYIPKYQETLLHLQDIVYTKILNISMEILKGASNNIDTETGNMQAVVKDENTKLCVWANLMRKSRFKCLTFKEVGMGFELTKQLAMSNIAVRILHTTYDHLSTLSRITHVKTTVAPPRLLTVFDEVPQEVPEQDDGEKEIQEEMQEEQEEEPEEEQEQAEEEVSMAQYSEETKGSESQLSRDSTHTEDGESQVVTQVEVVEAEPTPPPPEEDEVFSNEGDEVVDLRMYTPLGGVFYYEMFYLPPQSIHINGWEIRRVSESRLKVFQYIPEKSEDEESASTLVGVSVRLPDTVVFLETPRVGRWDAEAKYWRMDGISDFTCQENAQEEEEEGEDDEEEVVQEETGPVTKVSFKMDSFYPFVFMQKTYANFPFRSWEVRPLGKDSALFTIHGALIDLTITIQGDQCMLQTDRELNLANLFGKWMSAPDLQQAMIKAGLNVFVNEHTDKFVTSCRKDPRREHVAYEQMSLFASVCTFSWSKWNAQCGPQYIVVKVSEHQGIDPVPEDSWNLFQVGAKRFQKLEITETSEEFCADHHPESEFHSTFIHMLQDNMSPEGISRTREAHFIFVDTVQSLFCATRPLMFC
ncbi:dynein axonemal intermediate chain 7 isoform X2 [Syngnathus scovelli]|uniref:dynein axonemal intermediate chain 7 isoform X2 n=1 Tax=Syngnathus scovelli TaxID=161590 RepID=UPI00211062EE|nr:dynein axonemal intermediate chain 7 isoform X2 [Syngnathus scovelli]